MSEDLDKFTVWRNPYDSISVGVLSSDTEIKHYFTRAEASVLVGLLQDALKPCWRLAGPNVWLCDECRRLVSSEDRPEPCSCLEARAALTAAAGE